MRKRKKHSWIVWIGAPIVAFIASLGVPDGESPSPVCASSYTVATGDTCSSVASRFEMSSQALIDLNRGLDCSNLEVGHRICVKE